MKKKSTSLDKYIGCILGGAIGDSLGMRAEFVPRDLMSTNIIHNYPISPLLSPSVIGPLSKLQTGSYTDDTVLNIAQIRHYIKTEPMEAEPIKKIRGSLASWHNEWIKNRNKIKRI